LTKNGKEVSEGRLVGVTVNRYLDQNYYLLKWANPVFPCKKWCVFFVPGSFCMYLFFVRDFNDIDHITPVVWKMKQGNYPVAVYCINPEYDIQSDYRLNFLKELGVKIDFIYNAFDQQQGWLHRILRFLVMLCLNNRKVSDRDGRQQLSFWSKTFSRHAKRNGYRLYDQMRSKFYDTNWAKKFLERSQALVLCFDWIRPHKYVVESLLKAAKAMSIPTVALPHGVFLYTNDSVQVGSKKEGQFDRYTHFDYVIVQNRLFKKTISKSGVTGEKIFVLGSARYCQEWMAQNNKILPRKINSADDKSGKLKVVFMTTRPHYRIDVERMLSAFNLLANLDDIEVRIKPHTRTGKEATMYANLPLFNVADVSSVELCEWADVTLVIASSIIIETLIRRKPVLYLQYLHENTTEYEKMGACWPIHSEMELKKALLSLKEGQKKLPYTDENVNHWLSEIVYGGRPERDVLQDYEHFIVNCVV
jgi:hypothetical protein